LTSDTTTSVLSRLCQIICISPPAQTLPTSCTCLSFESTLASDVKPLRASRRSTHVALIHSYRHSFLHRINRTSRMQLTGAAFQDWDTSSQLITGGTLSLMSSFDSATSMFSHKVNIQHHNAFTLRPVTKVFTSSLVPRFSADSPRSSSQQTALLKVARLSSCNLLLQSSASWISLPRSGPWCTNSRCSRILLSASTATNRLGPLNDHAATPSGAEMLIASTAGTLLQLNGSVNLRATSRVS